MSETPEENTRTIVLLADDRPLPVVFEMGGEVITVPPEGQLRFVVSGPASAQLTIGYGRNGVSVYRDLELIVDIFDHDGVRHEVRGFA